MLSVNMASHVCGRGRRRIVASLHHGGTTPTTRLKGWDGMELESRLTGRLQVNLQRCLRGRCDRQRQQGANAPPPHGQP